jgi:hypothetical protein
MPSHLLWVYLVVVLILLLDLLGLLHHMLVSSRLTAALDWLGLAVYIVLRLVSLLLGHLDHQIALGSLSHVVVDLASVYVSNHASLFDYLGLWHWRLLLNVRTSIVLLSTRVLIG